MPYADTDFFVALAMPGDRLGKSATIVYSRYKGNLYTSLVTVIELALIAKRLDSDVEQLLSSVLSMAKIEDADSAKVLLAAYLIKNKGVGVFDAFHAALCGGEIISSDHIYDGIGLRRIPI